MLLMNEKKRFFNKFLTNQFIPKLNVAKNKTLKSMNNLTDFISLLATLPSTQGPKTQCKKKTQFILLK
jgi:hypothetical protein